MEDPDVTVDVDSSESPDENELEPNHPLDFSLKKAPSGNIMEANNNNTPSERAAERFSPYSRKLSNSQSNRSNCNGGELPTISENSIMQAFLSSKEHRSSPKSLNSPIHQLPTSTSTFSAAATHKAASPLITPFLASILAGEKPEPEPSKPEVKAKTVRPFKAYNPGDPSSALNIFSAQTPPSPTAMANLGVQNYALTMLRAQMAATMFGAGTPGSPRIPSGSMPDFGSLLRSHSLPAPGQTPKNISPPDSVTSSTLAHSVKPAGHAGLLAGLIGNSNTGVSGRKRENSNSPTSTSDLATTIGSKPDSPHQLHHENSSGVSTGSGSVGSGSPPLPPMRHTGLSTSVIATTSAAPVQSRRRGRSMPEELKDGTYWERRRKNNEAAKRSRDARRMKEDEIALKAAFLENENMKLKIEVQALRNEVNKCNQLLLATK